MRRRDLLGGAIAGAALAPFGAASQQKAMPVIGWLGNSSPGAGAISLAAFRQGLGDGGYIEGQNVTIEYRWAEGRYERLPALALDLVAHKVDVIVTGGGTAAANAAKSATSTIPIVFVVGADPIELGLVASLAHPDGNLTGIGFLAIELAPKQLEVLSELVPDAKAVALMVNPGNSSSERTIERVQSAAREIGVPLHILKAHTEHEIDASFATIVELGAGALVIGADPFFVTQSDQLVALSSRHSIPAISAFREFVAGGGLLSYGTSLMAAQRHAGVYAGKILKGARPTDLPVEQPTRFELVINLKTAKALGLTVPQSLLARADEVIE